MKGENNRKIPTHHIKAIIENVSVSKRSSLGGFTGRLGRTSTIILWMLVL